MSVYGPVASGAEWVAAELGGTSLARIIFWLKLEEALAFGAVIVALDRMVRSDPALRLRAHLLWSVNPLLLWEIVASGHVDGLAAVFGLLGVAALRLRDRPGDGQGIGLRGAAASGLLIGVATGIKVEYALFAVAIAWASRGRFGLSRPLRPGSRWWSSPATSRPGPLRSRCSSPAAPGLPGTPCTSSSGGRCSGIRSSACPVSRRT